MSISKSSRRPIDLRKPCRKVSARTVTRSSSPLNGVAVNRALKLVGSARRKPRTTMSPGAFPPRRSIQLLTSAARKRPPHVAGQHATKSRRVQDLVTRVFLTRLRLLPPRAYSIPPANLTQPRTVSYSPQPPPHYNYDARTTPSQVCHRISWPGV